MRISSRPRPARRASKAAGASAWPRKRRAFPAGAVGDQQEASRRQHAHQFRQGGGAIGQELEGLHQAGGIEALVGEGQGRNRAQESMVARRLGGQTAAGHRQHPGRGIDAHDPALEEGHGEEGRGQAAGSGGHVQNAGGGAGRFVQAMEERQRQEVALLAGVEALDVLVALGVAVVEPAHHPRPDEDAFGGLEEPPGHKGEEQKTASEQPADPAHGSPPSRAQAEAPA